MSEHIKPKKCENCKQKEQRYIEWSEVHELWLCDGCNEILTGSKAHESDSSFGYLTTEGNYKENRKWKMIDNNTTNNNGTHFLRGVELVNKATEEFNFHTENWAYPTSYRYGNPRDRYYAEVWHNGMDWDTNYWLIETAELIKPTVYPFIYFSSNDERYKYNNCDFEDLCNAIMHYRREITWIKSNNPKGYYSDTVWPFIDSIKPEEKLKCCECMVKHRIIHASQKRCEFYLNVNLIPNLKRVNHNNVIEDRNVKITTQYPILEEFSNKPTEGN